MFWHTKNSAQYRHTQSCDCELKKVVELFEISLKVFLLWQVLIFPSAKAGNSLSSANVWLHVVGSHTETDYLHLPRGIIHFSFWAR